MDWSPICAVRSRRVCPRNRTAVPEAQIRQIEAWINQGAKIDPVKLSWPYLNPIARRRIPAVKIWTCGIPSIILFWRS